MNTFIVDNLLGEKAWFVVVKGRQPAHEVVQLSVRQTTMHIYSQPLATTTTTTA